MIIDFNVNFNKYEEEILNSYKTFNYTCPTCGAKHSLFRHAKYERYIATIYQGEVSSKKLEVLRLKCSSCDKTHAILPADTIPYCIYSYSCILTILLEHFIDKKSILDLAGKFNISFQIIYLFISRFKEFLKECIYVLRLLYFFKDNEKPSFHDALTAISNGSIKNQFLKIFFSKTKWMLLMKKFLNIIPRPITIGSCNT
jgi:hypothetical protein